jgi:hypothetical protein
MARNISICVVSWFSVSLVACSAYGEREKKTMDSFLEA